MTVGSPGSPSGAASDASPPPPTVTAPTGPRPDLRRDSLAAIRTIDSRSADRDFWSDEAAIWDRFIAVGAGLDDAAWRMPGAAPSDAGGPDWSLLDHVAHVVGWQELGIAYIAEALGSGRWPSDEDYDGGDFDRYNERLRAEWRSIEPAELRARARDSHDRVAAFARELPLRVIRSDAAWGWVYMILHGHELDHLSILEPWADALRPRQVDGDPLAAEGEYRLTDPAGPIERFWTAEATIARQFDEVIRTVPPDAWEVPDLTPGWTLKDHVAHMAAWFDEAADAIDSHVRDGGWRPGPPEGVDAWNARAADRDRGLSRPAVLERFDRGRLRLIAAVRALPIEELREPEGWSWAYEDLHGHVRAHLAMVGPFCATVAWPAREDAPT